MPKENGKIRSEYLLAALMCIAVAFFLTILIVGKSCSADLPEEESSSAVTSSEPSSEPPASSTPSVQNRPTKVETVPLGTLAKVTEGLLVPAVDPNAPGSDSILGGELVSLYGVRKTKYGGDEETWPYRHSVASLELREHAAQALDAMTTAYNTAMGNKPRLVVDRAYLGTDSSETGAVAENLASGCAVLFHSAYGSDSDIVWLADNCTNYGYILRYPADKAEFTHQQGGNNRLFRYVGYEHAAYMRDYSLSLEEYLEVLRSHTSDNPLAFSYTDENGELRSCEVYFVPVTGGEAAELPIRGGAEADFRYTGNGTDGIIVTCMTD